MQGAVECERAAAAGCVQCPAYLAAIVAALLCCCYAWHASDVMWQRAHGSEGGGARRWLAAPLGGAWPGGMPAVRQCRRCRGCCCVAVAPAGVGANAWLCGGSFAAACRRCWLDASLTTP